MFWYILFISVGIFMLTMALCKTASREDERMEIHYKIYQKNKDKGDKNDKT